jgi:Mlc titration factor MtfA (ptsG expression regulator)
MKFNIMGRIIFGLPLTPGMRDKKSIRQYLKGKSTIGSHGVTVRDDVRLFIKTDKSYSYTVWNLSSNCYRSFNGMGLLAYSK